eukprot:5602134-Amphidinium_carterae.1
MYKRGALPKMLEQGHESFDAMATCCQSNCFEIEDLWGYDDFLALVATSSCLNAALRSSQDIAGR